jgi:hypothetical protein
MCRQDTLRAHHYTTARTRYVREIKDSVSAWRARIGDRTDTIAVICAHHQKPLLQWMGFRVVETYTRKENMSARTYRTLIAAARTHNVALVVDNLQSGKKTGMPVARESDAEHIALSNFPLQGSYLQTLSDNISMVLEGLRSYATTR